MSDGQGAIASRGLLYKALDAFLEEAYFSFMLPPMLCS
jgi:hypothetical protein